MDVLIILKDLLSIVGAISTIVGFYELYRKFLKWREKKRERKRHAGLLKTADYFIAEIIFLGGINSMVYSLQVYSPEEGGYYFNPPKEFVSVGFNRAGDLAIVAPTSLSRQFGFRIDSVATSGGVFTQAQYSDICHLTKTATRSVHSVKFVKGKESGSTDSGVRIPELVELGGPSKSMTE